MKMASMTRSRGQVYSVGNYLMTGRVLGKGHFARVEEATHRIIGKKVAIKIIDLTCIKEEYARRNLHREPRVMAKLRHPCIAALYETMMHGPRLYVVMEAACGGDLCAHVLQARGSARGLPEPRARALATQLVSAVRHMHSRGVVHRDLKMENIILDSTKQYIKIVDFGLSNVWRAGGALATPCGSLEYAAPELFEDGRRYGPEVDLWSIGVIVYGMVTGALPFSSAPGGASGSRSQLRAAIARGVTRKQRAALVCVSTECKNFIHQLLEPKVELRMKIEEASRHRWIKKSGMRMKTHPLGSVDSKANREIYRQISELSGQTLMDVVAHIKADPFGAIAGIYNIKTHLHQLNSTSIADLLWSANPQESRPQTPPEYHAKYELDTACSSQKTLSIPDLITKPARHSQFGIQKSEMTKPTIPKMVNSRTLNVSVSNTNSSVIPNTSHKVNQIPTTNLVTESNKSARPPTRPMGVYGLKKPVFKVYDNGDGLDRRLPSINEHSNTDVTDAKKTAWQNRNQSVRRADLDEPLRLSSCPNRSGDVKRDSIYKRVGDGLQSWRNNVTSPSTRILLQSTATTIKRASLGNITSPHSSSNSHCKSERAMPVGWFSTRPLSKETHSQRLRRTALMK
ncbi:serine/threonine-protein kinase MARK1-like [Nymphalis io]|uniref:serine/threonine-protein kinase MARK1-like n=1 Tax=Inachis io TaxID=171585 RepID=UPI002168AA5B|nr:serine/threonine-protein kinase MARK1-like [Nymphalis io]